MLCSLTKQTEECQGERLAPAVLYFVAMSHVEEHDNTKRTAEKLHFKPFRKLSSLLQPSVLNWNEEAQTFENGKHIKSK